MTMGNNNHILIVLSIGEIKIHFNHEYYRPDKDAVHHALIAGAFTDYSSETLIDIKNGLITCRYAPAMQDLGKVLRSANHIAEVIQRSTQ